MHLKRWSAPVKAGAPAARATRTKALPDPAAARATRTGALHGPDAPLRARAGRRESRVLMCVPYLPRYLAPGRGARVT